MSHDLIVPIALWNDSSRLDEAGSSSKRTDGVRISHLHAISDSIVASCTAQGDVELWKTRTSSPSSLSSSSSLSSIPSTTSTSSSLTSSSSFTSSSSSSSSSAADAPLSSIPSSIEPWVTLLGNRQHVCCLLSLPAGALPSDAAPSPPLLLTASVDGSVQVWDLRQLVCLATHPKALSSEATQQVLPSQRHAPFRRLELADYGRPFVSMVHCGAGRLAVSYSGRPGAILLFLISQSQFSLFGSLASIPASVGAISQVTLLGFLGGPSDQKILSCSHSGLLLVWSCACWALPTARLAQELPEKSSLTGVEQPLGFLQFPEFAIFTLYGASACQIYRGNLLLESLSPPSDSHIVAASQAADRLLLLCSRGELLLYTVTSLYSPKLTLFARLFSADSLSPPSVLPAHPVALLPALPDPLLVFSSRSRFTLHLAPLKSVSASSSLLSSSVITSPSLSTTTTTTTPSLLFSSSSSSSSSSALSILSTSSSNPLPSSPAVYPTCFCVIPQLLILITGFSDGSISAAMLPSDPNPRRLASTHTKAVRALWVDHAATRLVSGGDDGKLLVIDLHTSQPIFSQAHLFNPILNLVSVPIDAAEDPLDLLSICSDGTLILYSLQGASIQLRHVFTGHSLPLIKLRYRRDNRSLIVQGGDETIWVWCLDTGIQRRVIPPWDLSFPSPADLIHTAVELLPHSYYIAPRQIHNIPLSLSAVRLPRSSVPVIPILFWNIRRIIESLPLRNPNPSAPLLSSSSSSSTTTTTTSSSSSIHIPAKASSLSSLPLSLSNRQQVQQDPCSVPLTLLAYLFPWGIDSHSSPSLRENSSLSHLRQIGPALPQVTAALRGDGGLTVSSPPAISNFQTYSAVALQISPRITASRLLSLTSLAFGLRNMDSRFDTIGREVLDVIGALPAAIPGYVAPDISFFADYWSDRQSEIRSAARALFRLTVSNDSSAGSLFSHLLRDNSVSSLLLLTLFGTQFPKTVVDYQVDYASSSDFAAEISLLQKTNAPPVRITAADIIAVRVVRLAETMCDPFAASATAITQHQSLLLSFARGFNRLWKFHFRGSMLNQLISCLVEVAVQQHHDDEHRLARSDAARICLSQIASSDTQRFVKLVHKMSSKSPDAALEILTILSKFIEENTTAPEPGSSSGTVSPLVADLEKLSFETVSRIIDYILILSSPSNGRLREKCLPLALEMLRRLSSNIKTLRLFPKSNRLAVATPPGPIMIYDMKHGTEWALLEGHTSPASLVAFEPKDGKMLASFAPGDRTLRIWDLEPGFLGLFGAASPRCILTRTLSFAPQLYDPLVAHVKWIRSNILHLFIANNVDPIPIQIS